MTEPSQERPTAPTASSTATDGASDTIDLTPRQEVAAPRRSARNWLVVGVFTLLLGGLVYQALSSAKVYFYNVDEAVERRGELGDDTFRIQGTVTEITEDDANGLVFTISYNAVSADVRHIGEEPTDLFELGVPVVAEGHWDGDEFVSTQLLIKHSETYIEDNPDRVSPDEALSTGGGSQGP